MHCVPVACLSPEMLKTPWARSCFGVHTTVNAWLHLLLWWAKKTACWQSCPSWAPLALLFNPPLPICSLVKLLYARSLDALAGLSDPMELGGRGGRRSCGGAAVGTVAARPWRSPLPLYSPSICIHSARHLGSMPWTVPFCSEFPTSALTVLCYYLVLEQCRYENPKTTWMCLHLESQGQPYP